MSRSVFALDALVVLLLGSAAGIWWRRRREPAPAAAARRSPASIERAAPPVIEAGPPPPLPAGWERWGGARPEPRGWPGNTILALPGLQRLTQGAREALLDLCDELGIPIDSLATVMSRESGFRADALNPLPAAGLIQLTQGAHLPGFDSADRIREVATWSDERQVREVVRPYYARMARAARGADPGRLYLLNFLPVDADKAPDFRLGDSQSETKWRRQVYESNSGLDREKKGHFTIADVLESVAATTRGAHGARMAVDGTKFEPGSALAV